MVRSPSRAFFNAFTKNPVIMGSSPHSQYLWALLAYLKSMHICILYVLFAYFMHIFHISCDTNMTRNYLKSNAHFLSSLKYKSAEKSLPDLLINPSTFSARPEANNFLTIVFVIFFDDIVL